MGAAARFEGRLGAGEGLALFVEVPFDVKARFGKARLPAKVTLNGYAYRTTIAVYGGKYYVGVRREHREAAGVAAGQLVKVTLEPDTEPRVVDTPPELAEALAKKKHAKARAAWDALSYSHKKEHAGAITSAKKPETRDRRVAKTIEMLLAKPPR